MSVRSGNPPPKFVALMDRLAQLPTRGAAEQAVLLAAVRWVGDDGTLWPAVDKWARLARVDVRTLQRVLRRLSARGIVELIEPSTGGLRRTARYRVPAFIENPGTTPGIEPRRTSTKSPAGDPANPGTEAREPRPTATQSSKEQPKKSASEPVRAFAWDLDAIKKANGDPNR